ncbi:MAG: class I SAM-dependent methyltransferase [Actinomycetota bacterium]
MPRSSPDPDPAPALEEGRACEACGVETRDWRVGPTCVLHRCPSCGHVERDLEECGKSARGHPWGGSGVLDRIRSTLALRSIDRLLQSRASLRVLEIGFGEGMVLSGLMDRGHDVSGIDPGVLERDLPPSLRRRATIHAQPAEEVELPERSFDLIYGIHVVEHLRDPALVLRACHQALRPGGILYLMTPDAASDGLRLFGERWWNLEDPTHVRFFSPRSISIMLSRAGFRRARIRTPILDGLSIEISSLIRTIRPRPNEHGVLGSRAVLPLYVLLAPVALAARALWPRLSPSMEVVARSEP